MKARDRQVFTFNVMTKTGIRKVSQSGQSYWHALELLKARIDDARRAARKRALLLQEDCCS